MSMGKAIHPNEIGVNVPEFRFRAKDPASALTHFIGLVAAIFATPVLLVHASAAGVGQVGMIALSVFMISMILLYGASSTYHAFNVNETVNRRLRKIDHMMIFVLIAGTYTPFCVLVVGGAAGWRLLAAVWGIALAGIALKACWVTCPKWFSSVIYIAMGWACAADLPAIYAASKGPVFGLLLAGGLLYTVGGVIYALKLKVFNTRCPGFGSHEVFHLFVMAGSACHYAMMLCFLR